MREHRLLFFEFANRLAPKGLTDRTNSKAPANYPPPPAMKPISRRATATITIAPIIPSKN